MLHGELAAPPPRVRVGVRAPWLVRASGMASGSCFFGFYKYNVRTPDLPSGASGPRPSSRVSSRAAGRSGPQRRRFQPPLGVGLGSARHGRVVLFCISLSLCTLIDRTAGLCVCLCGIFRYLRWL